MLMFLLFHSVKLFTYVQQIKSLLQEAEKMNKLTYVFTCLLLIPAPVIAMPYTTLPPPGICIFDIDKTLTEPGSFAAVQTCVALGYGIGINTGESLTESQKSMNAIYNGLSERGDSLTHLHPENGTKYYDFVSKYYDKYHQLQDLPIIIGDGKSIAAEKTKMPANPGDVNKDYLFQYSGGCKDNAEFQCTNYPYKHEGLESIAEFYKQDYKRSQPGQSPPAASDEYNECVMLFDDQKSTIEQYANNITGNLANTTEFSKKFRGVFINEPGWTFDTENNAKETVCNTIRNLPSHCQVAAEKITEVCSPPKL